MFRITLSTVAFALPLIACGGKEGGGGSAGGVSPAVLEASKIYTERCVPCHGENGHGDGINAATLNPKPRNFADPEWQKSVTDTELLKAIKEGGAAVGKSVGMPANPDIKDPDIIVALKDKVRRFGAAK